MAHYLKSTLFANAAVNFSAIIQQDSSRFRFTTNIIGIGQTDRDDCARIGHFLRFSGWRFNWLHLRHVLTNRTPYRATPRQAQERTQDNPNQHANYGGRQDLDAFDGQVHDAKRESAKHDSKDQREKHDQARTGTRTSRLQKNRTPILARPVLAKFPTTHRARRGTKNFVVAKALFT
jgi:hypothetical protein